MEENTIICGDCLEVMKDWPDGCVDLVLTDPPYGTTACKWDTIIPLEPMWKQLKRLIKLNGVVALTASQPFTSILVNSNLRMFRHEWIWIKNRGSNFGNTVREPMKEHESVVIFSCGKWTYNKQMQSRTGGGDDRVKYDFNLKTASENYREFPDRTGVTFSELRVPSSLQRFNTVCGKEKTKHPTQKPVALMEYLIKTYTNKGESVLDFACGSGTTCKAAQNLGRRYIGIDISEEYCQIARDRLRAVDTGVPVKEARAGQGTLFE